MPQVEMKALRRFPRQVGDGVQPVQEGDVFMADEKEIRALQSTGKAEPTKSKPVVPVKKGN